VEAALIAASYAIVYPLLGYLAAVLPFWAAAVLALGAGSGLLLLLTRLFLAKEAVKLMAGLVALTLLVPTVAVVLEAYTGLVYTLEATAVLAASVVLLARPGFRAVVERALFDGEPGSPPLKTPIVEKAEPRPAPPPDPAPAPDLKETAMRTALRLAAGALTAAALASASPARAEPATGSPSGTVSLPLSELLDLRRELDLARTATPPATPVPAVLEKLELEACSSTTPRS
jgi:hypothetical protein